MFLPEKVIIADDHPLFRQALLETLKQRMTTTNWFQAETVEELDQLLLEETDADLLLLDLNIPGAHGFNTLIHVRQHFPQIPVVVVSAYEDIDTINKAMSYGASGFVPKSTDVNTIFTAINQVLSGQLWTPEVLNTADASDSKAEMAERIASLTPQQYKILLMFAEGLLNKQIAYDLHVSEATIKAHATAIFRKLKVNNRTQAVISLNQLDLNEGGFSRELSQ
ncbi:DNA-binding response regulator [Thalassotalea sp. 42_200_T64]|nr:DNA-binding response regulator [Thalassotalea sp. 42_200_T64]